MNKYTVIMAEKIRMNGLISKGTWMKAENVSQEFNMIAKKIAAMVGKEKG